MEQVRIDYLGHACFRLSWKGQRIILDPYADNYVPGCPPLQEEAEFVYCSHEHKDHCAPETVTLTEGAVPAFGLTELLTDHDDEGGSKRGKNMIRIFDFGGVRVAHFGDLGRRLSPAEAEALQGLDCAMMPVGGFFTIDGAVAAEIAGQIRPKCIIPMHYRSGEGGYDVLATLPEALKHFSNELRVVPLNRGESITLE